MDPMQFEQMMVTLTAIQSTLEKLLLKKEELKARKLVPRPETWQAVREDVDREYLMERKTVNPTELQKIIDQAKLWMWSNPQKGADSKWTLTTSRMLTFLKDKPERHVEPIPEKKTSQIQI